VVLDSNKENDFHSAFETSEEQLDHPIHSQGDYLEEMAAKIGDLNQYFLFGPSLETFQ
jgi:hypothetical protein